jgi:DNA gyrase subunit B
MYYNNQPPKLIDCREHGAASGSELFIVEGDSASQAVAKQRDGRLQAVLPMQGKPMNALHVSQEKLQDNVLYAALIQVIGAGVGEKLNITQRRYQRIILMMDPDADGIHCGALMTLFFYQWMRPLLEAGAIYLVRPPVGQRTHLTTQAIEYAYTVPNFRKMLTHADAEQYDNMKYRGLAGIPQQSLEAFCINRETRREVVLREKDAKMAMDVFA